MEVHGLRFIMTAILVMLGSILLAQRTEANIFSTFGSMLSMKVTGEAPYTVVRKARGYEERHYGQQKFVCRQHKGPFTYQDKMNLFMSLMKYFTGDNKEGIKMDMSVPVSIKAIKKRGAQEYEACIYITPKYQDSPPTPKDADTIIIERKPITVLTRRFGGLAYKKEHFVKEAKKLYKLVKASGDTAIKDLMYWNVYDGPLTWWNRRNEIWLMKQE